METPRPTKEEIIARVLNNEEKEYSKLKKNTFQR